MIDAADVRVRLDAVIAAAKQSGAWDVARPDDAAFVDMGAFGMKTMAFEQWLRFVFVPNALALIAAGGPWPTASSVATIAVREGDTNPAVAALVDSLAAFDALFSPEDVNAELERDEARGEDAVDHNAAGWALVGKPGHTPAELEEAIACFRRSIEHDRAKPQAVANLGNALVELGREAVAVTELEHLAVGDDALAGAAHNWLGWRLAATDPARALAHLRDATRLRPTWGIAWQNLARVLDAAGEVREACAAYGTAIECGDAHDDAFGRDRRLQLEMQLAGRGEPVPAVPEAARADSAAFAIVREMAARVPTPRMFAIRPTTRESPWAMIGTVVDGRALGHAIVGARRDQVLVTRFARAGDVLVFEQQELAPPAAGEALVAWLAALSPTELTPLDAAMYLRDQVLGAPWRWEIASYKPAGMALVEPAGTVRVTVTARPGGGLDVGLFPEGPGASSTKLAAETPARLLELGPAIAEATTRALAARDAFAVRTFGIHHVATTLVTALPDLREPTFDRGYPAWPKAWLQDAADGVTLVWLEESAAGCEITIGRTHWSVHSADELAALVPAIAEALQIDRKLVRASRIKVGDRFRVRVAFGSFEPGMVVAFTTDNYDPRGDYRAIEFREVNGTRGVWLDENTPPDGAVLADLDRYLAPL